MLTAARYNERWYRSVTSRAVNVRPMLFVAERSAEPAAPCFRCGARGACRHREFAEGRR